MSSYILIYFYSAYDYCMTFYSHVNFDIVDLIKFAGGYTGVSISHDIEDTIPIKTEYYSLH